MSRRDDAVETTLAVARTAYDHEIQYPAAAIAYYAFVALLPLLVILLAVVAEPIAERVRVAAFRFLTPEAQRLVSEALTDSSGKVGATLFAIVVLAWSGANITVGFQTIVERVEGLSERPLSAQLRDAVGILASLGLAMGSVVLASAFVALLPSVSWAVVGGFVVLLVTLTVAFLPLYYVPSRAVTSLWAAVPGALTAAFGWTVLLTAIQFYVENTANYALYGVLSGIILVLTSLYIAAVVLMVGVVVNVTLADESDASRMSR